MDVSRLSAGERWVLRYRLPDGSATDAIGWVTGSTPTAIGLDTAAGPVEVPAASLVAARRAPAAAGGPDPARTSPAQLEHIALPGWAAITEPLGDWTLRAAGGFTGRANSCLAVGDPGRSLAEAAQRIVEFSAEHGIRPWAQVVVGSVEEQGLVELGWQPAYVVADVLATRLADLLGADLPDPEVVVSETLSAAWERAYAASRPNNADPRLLRMLVNGQLPRAFGGVSVGEELIAIARGHLNRGWLGLGSIWTHPAHRQRGWATKTMMAIGHWAARRGGRWAYLQVAQGNVDASTAYERLGFRRHHSYRYLEAPGGLQDAPPPAPTYR